MRSPSNSGHLAPLSVRHVPSCGDRANSGHLARHVPRVAETVRSSRRVAETVRTRDTSHVTSRVAETVRTRDTSHVTTRVRWGGRRDRGRRAGRPVGPRPRRVRGRPERPGALAQVRGDRDRAAEVASWRRPPRSAWALNLLARSEPEHLNAMREAGSRLSESFGAGGDDIRTLQAGYRDSVEAATEAAMRLSGLDGETHRSRIRDTLLAASADPAVDEQLRTGTVTDDHDPPGFAPAPGRRRSVGHGRPPR